MNEGGFLGCTKGSCHPLKRQSDFSMFDTQKEQKLWIYTYLSPSANKGGFLTRHQGFDVYKLSSNSAADKITSPQPMVPLKEEQTNKTTKGWKG